MSETANPSGVSAVPPIAAAASVTTGITTGVGGTAGSGTTAPAAARERVEKAVVAVHGVGDQYQYATIQTVVNQVCRFYHADPVTPLGSFHNGEPSFAFDVPYPADELEHYAFAEVYWAKIPRAVVGDQHTLERAQDWARTIVERLKVRWRERERDGESLRHIDFPMVKRVLEEMIETLTVLERLCFLAERGGLFKFDLSKLVDDYLGDVQVVADFAASRTDILAAFDAAMEGVDARYPNADLYIVAHSEGTVVTLLGLLRAFRAATPPAWTARIRGVMTIGSPIDKHLGLWPKLFEGGPVQPPAAPIKWVNYYDLADPIGFELDDFRDYIANSDLKRLFDFTADDDIGFARYPFPGKAHVDYWNDDAIFRHFLANVVTAPTTVNAGGAGRLPAAARPEPKPETRPVAAFFSKGFPYALVCVLLLVAAYFPIVAVADFAGWQFRALALVGDAAAVACTLLATTIAVRIPRMTRRRHWYPRILVFYAVLVGVGAALLEVHANGWASYPERLLVLAALTAAVIVVAFGVNEAARRLSTVGRDLGAKPMLLAGTIVFFTMLWSLTEGGWGSPDKADHKLWPIVLSGAAFVYLWWLGTLIFDLAFVWHVYIRQSEAIKPLRRDRRQIAEARAARESAEAAMPEPRRQVA